MFYFSLWFSTYFHLNIFFKDEKHFLWKVWHDINIIHIVKVVKQVDIWASYSSEKTDAFIDNFLAD
jgi:hypothetical protein